MSKFSIWKQGILSIGWLACFPVVANASDIEMQAFQAFEQGRFDTAQQHYQAWYQQGGGAMALIGAGNSAYRMQSFEEALSYYRQAIWLGENDQQRGQALFNLGNALGQLGLWGLAVEAFQDALKYQPSLSKAQHNLALAQSAFAQQQAEYLAEQARQQKAEQKTQARKDLEGSFHGGQRPEPQDSDDVGSGGQGESDDGRSEGVVHSIPSYPATNASLVNGEWRMNSEQTDIEAQWQAEREVTQLQQVLSQLEDQQAELMIHLFEREAGFQARQKQVHKIPGVQPW